MPQKPLNGEDPIMIDSRDERTPCHKCKCATVDFLGTGSNE